MWQPAKGRADWTLVVDIDEHIHHPDLRTYLQGCTEQGVTIVEAIGYEMVSDMFPDGDDPLHEQVQLGVRSEKQDKLVAFNPGAVVKTHYQPGRHEAYPEGRIVRPAAREVQLLHFKHLGLDYLARRSGELRTGLKDGDLEKQWGVQYTWTRRQIAKHLRQLKSAALPIPGLGVLAHIGRDQIDDEATLRRAGLFDAAWYLRMYRDIDASETDPLIHYCSHGWHEGRWPNFYFNTEWYLEQNPEVAAQQRNPLVHYATIGEGQNSRPSDFFDPAWYRRKHRLRPDVSPLRHYLESRTKRKVAPMKYFDVTGYCAENADVLAEGEDPFEHYIAAQAE
jgi:hypothetical protein